MEGMRYFGIDIVPGLIEDNKQKFSTSDISFICADISNATFPDADLFFCRDCLFHLSFEDIRGVLTSFCKSNLKYLMTTTHRVPYRFSNYDIATGDFRVIDLFKPPFSFPEDVLFRVDDYRPPDLPREMGVFRVPNKSAKVGFFHEHVRWYANSIMDQWVCVLKEV